MLRVEDLRKNFGPTVALSGATFECRPGEVHALLGENGAGKSTLVAILAGILSADAGSIELDGVPLRPRSAAEARVKGIGVAFQELALVPGMTVAQNLLLGVEPSRALGLVSTAQVQVRAASLLESADVKGVLAGATVEDLPLSTRQKLEIVRATHHGTRVCVLDEPTSALTSADMEWFEHLLEVLRQAGIAVLFITHRLREIRQFCQRVTVLRQGASVGTWPLADVRDQDLVAAMLGRPMEMFYPTRPAMTLDPSVPPLLRIRHAHAQGHLRDLSIDVRRGEIVGVAGLQGHGQETLFTALFGGGRLDSDLVEVDGRGTDLRTPRAAIRAGLGFVPENRQTEGLLLDLPTHRNLTVTVLDKASRLGVMRPRFEVGLADRIATRLSVTRQAPWEPVSRLSGGTQQKVVLGKWLARDSRLLLLYDPTRGVDIGTKREIYDLLGEHTSAGGGVLWYSTDLDELANVCDRVVVMYAGAIIAEFTGPHIASSDLLQTIVHGAETSATPVSPEVEPSRRRQLAPPGRIPNWAQHRVSAVSIALALAIVLFIFDSVISGSGFAPSNLQSVINDSLGVGIAAIGETLVLLTGGFDLSAGAIVTLLNVILATHMRSGPGSEVGWVVVTLAAGAAMGVVNGASVMWLRLQSIVVTLAAGFVWYGVALLVLPSPGGNVPGNFVGALTGLWLGTVPLGAVVLAVVVISWWFLVHNRVGVHIYAVGGAPKAATANGVNRERTVVTAYALSGLFYGAAAVFFTAQTAGGDPTLGSALLLTFFAAAVVGGVRLGGGRGSGIGALIGAFILELIDQVLFAVGVSSYYTYIFEALVIVVAVVMMGWIARWGRKRAQPLPGLPPPLDEAAAVAPGAAPPGTDGRQGE